MQPYNRKQPVEYFSSSLPRIQPNFKLQQEESRRRVGSPHVISTSSDNGKMYQLGNFVGMMLEQLRFSYDALKGEVLKDRTIVLQGFREAAFSLRQLGQKIEQNQSNRLSQTEAESYAHLLKENQILNVENDMLIQSINQMKTQLKAENEKIKQESYQIFEENFILNQKIASLQQQLQSKTSEVVEDLKRQNYLSLEVLNHQISVLEETIKERDQSISILERLVKDYEAIQDKRSMRYAHEDNDHSKVLNMLSMDSHDSKRREISIRNGSYNDTVIRYDHRRQQQQRRYEVQSIGQMRNGSLPYSQQLTPHSPTNMYRQQFVSSFGAYRSLQPSIHSSSTSRLITMPSSNYQYPNNQQVHYQKQDPYLSGIQLKNNQNQYSGINVSSRASPRILSGSRFGSSSSRNQMGNFPSYSNLGHNIQQSPSMSIRSRQDERQQRRQLRRQTSRDQRLPSARDNKVDLSKIQQQLQGLAKQLKTQLDSISKKKL